MDPGAALTETVRSLTARLAAVEAKVGIETAASGAGAGAGAGTAAPPAVPKAKKKDKKPAAKPKPAPRLELVRSTWRVENYGRGAEPVHVGGDGVEMKHKVSISNCEFCNVFVDSRVTSVTVENCKKVNVVVDVVIASLEVFNSKSCKVQVKTRTPTVALDNVRSFMLYVPFGNRNVRIVSSNISDCNVSFPEADDEEAEWAERPIPEQFVSTIENDNSVKTTVSDIYG